MALDTGATSTLLSVSALVALGYDPTTATEHSEVATGSCLETVPFIVLQRIRALEQERNYLPVLCHTLPVEVGIDGLLGLDFLRDRRLVIDFRLGEIMLT